MYRETPPPMSICLYCCGLCVRAYALPFNRVGTKNSLAPSDVDLNRVGVSTSVKPLPIKPVCNIFFSHERNSRRACSSGWKRSCKWRLLGGNTTSGVTIKSFGTLFRERMLSRYTVVFDDVSSDCSSGVGVRVSITTGLKAGICRNLACPSSSIKALEQI